METCRLSDAQTLRIEARVAHECERAQQVLGIALPAPEVRFDLSGTAAGMFCRQEHKVWLRFNPWLFAKDFERHCHDTVIHEVAHYGIFCLLGAGRSTKPHGPEWQGLMIALGARPKATFVADLSGVPIRRQRRFRYRCDCQTHEVSATRHNRIRRNRAQYRCRYCDATLALAT